MNDILSRYYLPVNNLFRSLDLYLFHQTPRPPPPFFFLLFSEKRKERFLIFTIYIK